MFAQSGIFVVIENEVVKFYCASRKLPNNNSHRNFYHRDKIKNQPDNTH